MNKNKRYILYGLIVVVFISSLFGFLRHKKEIPLVIPNDKNYTEEKVLPKEEIKLKLASENKIETKKDTSIDSINFSLLVNGSKYESTVKDSGTVFEAMEKLENVKKDFTFKYTEHGSMGNFITEINGIKGTPGKYWIYYVNDKKPSVGASKYVLKSGDIIKWSAEGI